MKKLYHTLFNTEKLNTYKDFVEASKQEPCFTDLTDFISKDSVVHSCMGLANDKQYSYEQTLLFIIGSLLSEKEQIIKSLKEKNNVITEQKDK